MNRYSRGALAAIALTYQTMFGVAGLQAADWGNNLSQDVPKLEKYLKDAKEMGDLEKKVGSRLDKFIFVVGLTDSNEDYINILINEIQGKTGYRVSLEPINYKNYHKLVLRPSKTN